MHRLLRVTGALLLACLLALSGLRAITRAAWPTATVLTVYAQDHTFMRALTHLDVARRLRVGVLRAAHLGRASTLAWSPDGRTLAYAEGTDTGEALALFHAASGRTTRLPLSGESLTGAAWSPDGAWLATTLVDDVGVPRVFAFRVRHDDTGAWSDGPPQVLIEDAGAPVWSPDGAHVAVTDRLGEVGVWTAATGARRGLGVVAVALAWTPDGASLLVKDADARVAAFVLLHDVHADPAPDGLRMTPLAVAEGQFYVPVRGTGAGGTLSVIVGGTALCALPFDPPARAGRCTPLPTAHGLVLGGAWRMMH